MYGCSFEVGKTVQEKSQQNDFVVKNVGKRWSFVLFCFSTKSFESSNFLETENVPEVE